MGWSGSQSIALSLALAIASTTFASGPLPAKEKVLVGYVFGSTTELDFSLYTHICHAFVTADAHGHLNVSRTVPDRDLAARAHRAGVKVLLSLGGWGWDEQFAAMMRTPSAEDRYVAAVLKLIEANDYDGIDLDWEYPDNKEEVVGFERLSRRLRKGLDAIGAAKGRTMLLTMAASSSLPTLRWLDTTFLIETMDWINVMTYDYAGPWSGYAGHHAPLFPSTKQTDGPPRSVERTIRFLLDERKWPADRIALGLPLYGVGFAADRPYASTRTPNRPSPPPTDYAGLTRLMAKGWTRSWDEETRSPWLTSPDGSTVIGYDDERSLLLKIDWAKEQKLRGIFFWQANGDLLPDGRHPLQSVSAKRWKSNPSR